MRVTIGTIFYLGFLTISMTTLQSMCPPMAFNPFASMSPCNQEAKQEGSGNSGAKKPLPSYCTTDTSKEPSKPSCFSLPDFPTGGSLPFSSPRGDHFFPSWINIPLARKGQQFAQANLFGLLVSHVFGLFSSAYPDATGILCFTGASDTAALAERRYLATITQFILWYDDLLGDNTNTDSDILASIQRTQAMHISVAERAKEQMSRKQYLNDPNLFSKYNMTTALSGPFFRDLQESNIPPEQRKSATINPTPKQENAEDVKYPMNQQVASLMMFSLVGPPVSFPERFGIDGGDEEGLWGYSHLWAVLAYAVGVDDKYNVALQPNLSVPKEAYKKIYEDYQVRSVFNLNKDWISLVMGEKSLYGLQQILPILSPNMILYRMLIDLFQVPGKHTYDILTLEEKKANELYEADRKATLGSGKAKMAAMNQAARAVLMRDGFKEFGMDYMTQKDRARHVFFTT